MAVGGSSTSFAVGSTMLQQLMDLKVSARTINATTGMIGAELEQQRHGQAEAYQDRPLTPGATQANPPIAIACVEVDGGRMQTRTPGQGTGVHDPHGRENKNAGFFRMQGNCHSRDGETGPVVARASRSFAPVSLRCARAIDSAR